MRSARHNVGVRSDEYLVGILAQRELALDALAVAAQVFDRMIVM